MNQIARNSMAKQTIDIKRLHGEQLSILKEFDRICKKYGIHYYLAYGSLIGALRHNGFIPWDDDIDTVMPYEDYVKLQEVPENEWNYEFFLQSSETDQEYNKCYVKIRKSNTTCVVDDVQDKDINHGVAIDVYPMVHLANGRVRRLLQFSQLCLYMLFQENHVPNNHGLIYKIGAFVILKVIPEHQKNALKNRLLERATVFESNNTRYCTVICGSVKCLLTKLESDDFSTAVLHTFEDSMFPIPVGYDRFLSSEYGDYMALPPEDEQGVKLDHFMYVDFENPYFKYKGKAYCNKQNRSRK